MNLGLRAIPGLARYYWSGVTEKLGIGPAGEAGASGAAHPGQGSQGSQGPIKTTGYPRNHNYRIGGGRILPSLRLMLRLNSVGRLLPADMDSLLDIGCCRGAFVLTAARRPGCRRAVGIDVDDTFVQTAEAVRQAVGIDHARFQKMAVHECVEGLAGLGGPFHTVLVLGLYHYLFWGSQDHPDGYLDHDKILSMLAGLCSSQVLLAARLQVDRCPTFARERAAAMAAEQGHSVVYSPARFLECAARYFDVDQAGRLGNQTLYRMRIRAKG